MAGSDSAKPASTKRTEAPGDASSSSQSGKRNPIPLHNTSALAGPKASQAANADAETEANDGRVDGGEAAEERSNPNSPNSTSSSSSTDPAFEELEKHLNNVFLILKTALKVLDIAGQDGCSFAEAMPPVPGWSDACKVILLDVLEKYRGGEGQRGMQVELLKRMAREAAEVMAIIEREGRERGDDGQEQAGEDEGGGDEGEGVELAEWVE